MISIFDPEYRLSNFDYEGAFQSGLTHLIYFSLEVSVQTGKPAALDRLPSREDAARARLEADKVNGKILISFGGNGRSSGFAEMTASKKKRKRFLKELNSILNTYKFDGVDYNW